MINIVFLLLSTIGTTSFTGTPSIQEVRQIYQEAASGEKQCKKLVALLAPYTEKNNPLLAGYKGSATMLMARYADNPFTKLSYFKKGKKMVEKAIVADQMNVELRFLRFAAQTNAPSFLGYADDIETDKAFLLKSISQLRDPELRITIISYLKNSGALTTKQKQQLNRGE
ncbi:MAG: hypothetical protein ACXWC7_10485 [Chitinophagaceae bacterium]